MPHLERSHVLTILQAPGHYSSRLERMDGSTAGNKASKEIRLNAFKTRFQDVAEPTGKRTSDIGILPRSTKVQEARDDGQCL